MPGLGRRLLAGVALGLALVCAGAPSAMAQPEDEVPQPPKTVRAASNQEGVFRITERSVEWYTKLLKLDEEQQAATRALLAGHREAIEAKRRDLIKAREETVKEEGGDGGFRAVMEFQRQMAEVVSDAEDTFLKDLRVMLKAEQLERWPRVERYDRRSMYRGMMGNMPVSSTSTDLVEMVGRLKPGAEAEAKIEPRLLRYETDLDALLVRFKEAYEALAADQKKLRQLMNVQNDPAAIEQAGKVFNEFMDVARRIRDLNRRVAKELQVELGSPLGDRLLDDFRREMFPMLAQLQAAGIQEGGGDSRHAARVIEVAGRLEGLSDQQKQSMASVVERFYRDRRALYDEMERQVIEGEDAMTFKKMMEDPMGTVMRPGRLMKELSPKLAEIDARTVAGIRGVLSPEQAGKLPAEPKPGERKPARGTMGGMPAEDVPPEAMPKGE